MRLLLLAVASVAVFLSVASTCEGIGGCTCSACTGVGAIQLSVFDIDDEPLNDADWTVEATHDGVPVDDIGNCDPDFRLGNSCSFGFATGLYRITVRAPGFQTRDVAARFAAKSGDDCCTCLSGTAVTIKLEPVS